MGAPFSFSYGDPGIGGGDPFSIGGVSAGPGGIFNTPSPVQVPSGSGGPSNPGGSVLSQLLPWAQLGANTFLADQAITSPRPSTITYLPNGQIAATGGGASPLSVGTGSGLLTFLGTTAGLLFIVGVVVIIFVLKK